MKNIDNNSIILGIETSCDETAAAVVRGREVLSNVIASQIEIHKVYGGVVPEIASRNHTAAISGIVREALDISGLDYNNLDAVAVTYGAGLLGALLVGVSYAKAVSYTLNIPLMPVNHIAGHIAANYIAHQELEPPYICLLASGGHTAIIEVKGYTDFKVLGQTLDDAAGEAFDKVARLMGLSYPGGPAVEKLAREGKPIIELPYAMKGEDSMNFSYSGLKTAVMNIINKEKKLNNDINYADLAASFQKVATEMLVNKALAAARRYNYDKIAVAGGVGANGFLRKSLCERAASENIKVYLPPLYLCTDNAAMIACQGYYNYISGLDIAGYEFEADASIKLSEL